MHQPKVTSGSTQTGVSPRMQRRPSMANPITVNTMIGPPTYQYSQCRLSGAYSSACQLRST